ncbi:MAG: TetR/AcrR family transcriptional regulator [Bacteroidota bacterium]
MPETTEQLILEKAKEVFMQKGFAGARMQEIADAAGINKAMLHYYFRNKEKLFKVIIEEVVQTLAPKLGAALHGDDPVTEKLEKVIRLYIAMIKENPYMPMFLMHELSQNRAEFISVMKRRVAGFPDFPAFFMQVIQEQQAGKIKPINPIHLMMNIMGMVVFPFIAKPVVVNLLDLPGAQFDAMMQDRADIVVGFMKNALRVEKRE